MLRVLIAEDHPVYRDGLRSLLAAAPDIDLLGEAADGDEAVRMATELRPDVVLMDLQMPGRNGIEATRAIGAQRPATAVLILTMFDDDDSVFNAMRAGARGYLLKDAGGEDLLRAIDTVGHGGAVFGPGVARRLVAFFASGGVGPRAEPFPELTERERQVLDRIARGEGNAVIAARLGISLKTVRNYASTIFDKLMVVSRAEAIVRAREAGMGDAGEHG
ncbi:MAG TPA: response regulator transcription factor [Candidatus Limnocylindrales bacterium]|nr:response regulator transcription factor [Candidatus Limnocylindrales bacterium]